MKLNNKFLEPIPLNTKAVDQNGDEVLLISDYVTNEESRVAMRPEEQTFDGTKTFENLRLGSDPDKDDKSLVNVADLKYALAEVGEPVAVVDTVVLSSENIDSHSLTLSYEPLPSNIVKFTIPGSGDSNSIRDFTVNGKVVSWADNAYLCEILGVGDTLHFRYRTNKKGG